MLDVGLWNIATIIVGGIATLAIYSFLIKENSFYRFFEHLFIGIAAGYGPIFIIRDNLWPKILEPMLGLNIVEYPDGTFNQSYQSWYLIYLIPLAFGMLYYFIYSQRHAWLAKIVIGFSLGASAALTFKGFFAEVVPQITASFKPLVVFNGDQIEIVSSINNAVFVFTLLLVLYYFFFSFRAKSQKRDVASYAGRWLMMICFGAFFGSTVMARMALLVERLQFLLVDWWGAVRGVAGAVFYASGT